MREFRIKAEEMLKIEKEHIATANQKINEEIGRRLKEAGFNEDKVVSFYKDAESGDIVFEFDE